MGGGEDLCPLRRNLPVFNIFFRSCGPFEWPLSHQKAPAFPPGSESLVPQGLDKEVAQRNGTLPVHNDGGHVIRIGSRDVLQPVGGDGEGILHILIGDIQGDLQDLALGGQRPCAGRRCWRIPVSWDLLLPIH